MCKERNKGHISKNKFYRCLSYKMNLCPLCAYSSKHIKEHKNSIIDYDEKYYICEKHNKRFTSFCEDCQKNLCQLCLKEHKEYKNEKEKENIHEIINFKDLIPEKDEQSNHIKELTYKINQFKNIIDEYINKLKKVKKCIEIFYIINIDILTSLSSNNINYEILYNYGQMKKADIIKDMNHIINNNSDNNNIKNILNMYDKMTTKYNDEITINYNIRKKNKITLFSDIFIKNNKDNCKIIIEDEEYGLLN